MTIDLSVNICYTALQGMESPDLEEIWVGKWPLLDSILITTCEGPWARLQKPQLLPGRRTVTANSS